MKNKKIILISGVSSGIGKSFVEEALINSNWTIVGLGRNNINGVNSKRYIYQKTDLRSSDSIEKSFNLVIKKVKKIDVLINNAGFGHRATIEDISMDEIRNQFEVNFFGLIHLTKLVLPQMRERKQGHIINVSSVGSIISAPTLGLYESTKSAVDKISEVLAQEVSQFNVKVSLLVPGAVKTNFEKNIIESKGVIFGFYTDLYEEWKSRFRSYFKICNSSQEASIKLINLIQDPKPEIYIHNRDKTMCYLRKTLPHVCFQWLFLNIFYKNES